MSTTKKIANHPSLLFAEDLREICAPLKTLNITYFSHVQIDAEGRFAALGMQPEFAKLYFEKQYYNFDIHMAQLRQPEQYILWDDIELSKETKQLNEDFLSFDLDHTFTISQQNEQRKDYFHFSAKRGNRAINYVYLQNLDLLKKFIGYFNDKIAAHRYLRRGYDIKFHIEENRAGYFTKELTLTADYAEFDRRINTDRIYLAKNKYLTKREWQCLYWLAQGKTLEEAAIILEITLRTMKAHISNIKEKFACCSQFQLGMLFQELNKLKLIQRG